MNRGVERNKYDLIGVLFLHQMYGTLKTNEFKNVNFIHVNIDYIISCVLVGPRI